MTPQPKFLQPRSASGLFLAVSYKGAYTLQPPNCDLIAPYWGEACLDLLEEFQKLAGKVLCDKTATRGMRRTTDEARVEAYDPLSSNHNTYFEKAELIFEKAISELDKEGLNAEELEPYPESFISPLLKSGAPAGTFAPMKPPAASPSSASRLTPIKSAPRTCLPGPTSPVSKKRPAEATNGEPLQKWVREAVESIGCTTGRKRCLFIDLDVFLVQVRKGSH